MGIIALSSFEYLNVRLSQNLALIIAIGIGVLVYGILIYFMKIPEVERTLALVKRKLRSKAEQDE